MTIELTTQEKDIIQELSTICMGSAATALSGFIHAQIKTAPPQMVPFDPLMEFFEEKGVWARISFKRGLPGQQWVGLSERDGRRLACMMMGADPEETGEIGEMELSALQEAIGTAMGAYTTALAGMTGREIELESPVLELSSFKEQNIDLLEAGSAKGLAITFDLDIEPDQKLTWIQVVPLSLFKSMVAPLLPETGTGEPETDDRESEVGVRERDMLLDHGPGMEDEPTAHPLPALEDHFTAMEIDTVAEIGNISMGSSATTLSELVGKPVQITTPRLSISTLEEIQKTYPQPSLISRVYYRKGLEGENILILKEEDAALIAGLMMGLDPEEYPEKLDEISMSAISEAMNQMMGTTSTSMSSFLDRAIDISPPELECCNLEEDRLATDTVRESEPILTVEFNLEIGDLLQSNLLQIMPIPFAKEVTSFLLKDFVDAGKDPGENAGEVAAEPISSPQEGLDEMQRDTLSEVGNISLGSSATALAMLINRRVQITAPRVSLTSMKEVRTRFPVPCLVVKVNYIKGLEGENVLIIKEDDALIITGLMMGMEPPEKPEKLDELELSAVSEAMNQMMGAAATAMSDFFDRVIDISPPHLSYKDLHSDHLDSDDIAEDSPLAQISFRMEVEGLIDSELLQLVPLTFAQKMTAYLLSSLSGEDVDGFFDGEPVEKEQEDVEDFITPDADTPAWDPPEMLQKDGQTQEGKGSTLEEKVVSRDAVAEAGLDEQEYERLDMIRDIPVEISAVLGRTKIPLKTVTSLFPGDIVGLERYIGEPIDILANDRLVARGEVVLVNGQFGVKITSKIKS